MKKTASFVLAVIIIIGLTACSKQSGTAVKYETDKAAQTIDENSITDVTEEPTVTDDNEPQYKEAEKYGIYVKVMYPGGNKCCISEIGYGDISIKYEYYDDSYIRKSKSVNGVVTEYAIGTPEDCQNLEILTEKGENGIIEYIYEPGHSSGEILTGFTYNGTLYQYRFEYPYTYVVDEQGVNVAEYYTPDDGFVQVTNYTDEKIGDVNHRVREGGIYYDVETGLYSDSYGSIIFSDDGFFLYNNDTAEQVIEWLAEYWEIGE